MANYFRDLISTLPQDVQERARKKTARYYDLLKQIDALKSSIESLESAREGIDLAIRELTKVGEPPSHLIQTLASLDSEIFLVKKRLEASLDVLRR